MCAEIKIQRGLGVRRQRGSLHLRERMEPGREGKGMGDTDVGHTQ